VMSTILSLIFNIIFIPIWGITGAAVATLLSQFIYWISCYYFSQKAFFIPYEIGKITIIFFCGAVLSFSSLLVNNLELIPRMLIKITCLFSFPFILYLFNFYEPVELQAIRGFFTKWSKIRDLKSNLNSLKGITDDL